MAGDPSMTTVYHGPRRRGRPPRTTSSRVAATALRLFRERGFEATTADEIAVACGISRSTFFRYFGSKAEILWHCHAEQVAALEQRLRSAPAAADPFAVVANAVVDATRNVGAEEAAAARDHQALVRARPDLDPIGRPWSARRIDAIREYVAAQLRLEPFAMPAVAFAYAVDAAVRAAGVRFAHSEGEELHELVAATVAPIHAGFAASHLPVVD